MSFIAILLSGAFFDAVQFLCGLKHQRGTNLHEAHKIEQQTSPSLLIQIQSQQQQQQQPKKNEAAASSSPPIIQGTIPLHGKGLKMGQYAQVHRTFTQDDVNLFGRLSGDMNPVHFPPTTTPTLQTIYDKESSSSSSTAITNDSSKLLPIVHGILLSSLFSNIFGNLIPGAIYRHQSLKFHNAVHVNESVVGRVVVTKLRQINRKGRGGGVLCTCDTCVIKMDVAAAQLFDDETRSNDSNKHDGGSSNRETKEIVCISGDAQVWLPDLQLVYECREKGE